MFSLRFAISKAMNESNVFSHPFIPRRNKSTNQKKKRKLTLSLSDSIVRQPDKKIDNSSKNLRTHLYAPFTKEENKFN